MELSKSAIVAQCRAIIEQRVQRLEQDLQFLAKDIAEDTKSSAGDKYETSREMANLEREKLVDQLLQNKKAMAYLNNIQLARMTKVQAGALIATDAGLIFIAVSMGQVDCAGQQVLVISPKAPLAQAFLGVAAGAEVSFKNQSYKVQSVA